MKKAVLAATCAALVLSGCATKRYGRMQPLTVAEQRAYDCQDLDVEIAKVEAFRMQVADGAEFNLASVAGFLGDWGIGNSMERGDAEKSATGRMNDLLAAKSSKGCGRSQLTRTEVEKIEAEVAAEQLPVSSSGSHNRLKKDAPIKCVTCPK